ncbi:hypothetical protein QUW40_03125 [Collinsella tanakaei]|uniref:DUF3592 domain-containing protein n=1 Tax=Collinsella tanakaei TaxID=626935 RepID=UPI0025A3E362|nr:DUF3592 domain-containing protein [Collinsella tanakaei]MDM8245587.1 hypothetical protein [Collinsella tanakaei]
MSDGTMILLIFGLIALLGGGTTALALFIARRVREKKEREYTCEIVGTVVRFRRGGIDRPASVCVRYEVDGQIYECCETVKLRSEPIKIGSVLIGQRKTAKIATHVGARVRVAHLPNDPSKAILADSTGLLNE